MFNIIFFLNNFVLLRLNTENLSAYSCDSIVFRIFKFIYLHWKLVGLNENIYYWISSICCVIYANIVPLVMRKHKN